MDAVDFDNLWIQDLNVGLDFWLIMWDGVTVELGCKKVDTTIKLA